MRAQLRITIAVLVIVVIAIASIVEPPSGGQAVGFAAVAAVMVLVILRERGLIK